MSWSDHKDDKSRFDGWREFLNEGKEQQPEQVIKEEAQTISEEGDRPPRPSNQQRLVNNLLKGSPDFGKEWSSADLIAVAEAWKVINALSQDVQTAAAMDDAWSAIRQGVPGGGIQGWDKSVYVANALATGRLDLLRYATEDRLHQPARAGLYKGLYTIIRAALTGGAHGAFLSGAGPCVMAFATEHEYTVAYEMTEAARLHGIDASTRVVRPTSRGAHVID